MRRFMEWCSNKDYEQHLQHLTAINQRKTNNHRIMHLTHRSKPPYAHNKLSPQNRTKLPPAASAARTVYNYYGNKKQTENEQNKKEPLMPGVCTSRADRTIEQESIMNKSGSLTNSKMILNSSRVRKDKSQEAENQRIEANFKLGKRLLLVTPAIQPKKKMDRDYKTHLHLLKSITNYPSIKSEFRFKKYHEYQQKVFPLPPMSGRGKNLLLFKIVDIFLAENSYWSLQEIDLTFQLQIGKESDKSPPPSFSTQLINVSKINGAEFGFRFKKSDLRKVSTKQIKNVTESNTASQINQMSQPADSRPIFVLNIQEWKGNKTMHVARFQVNMGEFCPDTLVQRHLTQQIFGPKSNRSIGLIEYYMFMTSSKTLLGQRG